MIQRVAADIWRGMTQLQWPPILQVGTVKHPVHRNILHDHLPVTTIDMILKYMIQGLKHRDDDSEYEDDLLTGLITSPWRTIKSRLYLKHNDVQVKEIVQRQIYQCQISVNCLRVHKI